MSSGRFLQITGGAGVIGVAYYLYNAGGSPKLAEKKFEGTPSTPSSTAPLIHSLTNAPLRLTL